MITCPKCFKENQDHYKFCLGCGAELPRDASPKKFAAGTPPHGVPAARPSSGAIPFLFRQIVHRALQLLHALLQRGALTPDPVQLRALRRPARRCGLRA